MGYGGTIVALSQAYQAQSISSRITLSQEGGGEGEGEEGGGGGG